MKTLAAFVAATTVLAALAAAQEMKPLPFPVPLNHFFLVLDSDTYAAIEASQFLQTEFAVFERRTTVRADLTYTGVYFYGINTYFEFFDAAKEKGRRIGDSGVAFGVDNAGNVQHLQAVLGSDPPALITRQLGDRQVPWFHMLTPKDFPFQSGISTWIMEYHPRFLAEWHPEAGGGEGVTRRQILSRYAATLQSSAKPPLLQDVVGLTIAVDESTSSRLAGLCQAFGYSSRKEGSTMELGGPDVVLRLIPATASVRGIQQVDFRVSRMPEKQSEFKLGPKAVLKFQGGDRAVWSF